MEELDTDLSELYDALRGGRGGGGAEVKVALGLGGEDSRWMSGVLWEVYVESLESETCLALGLPPLKAEVNAAAEEELPLTLGELLFRVA